MEGDVMNIQKSIGTGTTLIHAGEPEPRIRGAVSMPIFQSSTYEYAGVEGDSELKYIRWNNTPNHVALHEKLAAVEEGEAALVTASGMAAISTTLLSILKPGDHVLAQRALYGGTYSFFVTELSKLGIQVEFFDGNNPSNLPSLVRRETKLIYVETIANPLLHMTDLETVVNCANDTGVISVIDNTFATPVNCKPITLGFDISLHSCTKYLNGHSDLVAGGVIGRTDLIEKISGTLIRYGGTLDPHACFLLHRGLKTLAVRMEYQNASGLRIARFFEDHPAVEKVYYPGLESHQTYGRARKLLSGFGGMISIDLKDGVTAVQRFMDRLEIALVAPSLGGVETLVSRPVVTSHVSVPPEERKELGITDSLVRLSIGLENTDDLIEDFKGALE